jgi:hypothetical protein
METRTSAVTASGTTRWIAYAPRWALSVIAVVISCPSRRITRRLVSTDCGASNTVTAQSPGPSSVCRRSAIPCTPSAAASAFASTTSTVPARPAPSTRSCPVAQPTPFSDARTCATTDAGARAAASRPVTSPATWVRSSGGTPTSTSRSAGSDEVRSSWRQ